ncbi:D-inositol 3-phosphate glycosyltransferase [Candidatus Xiphinematobacter sp. Idaho Grape]|uniref:glycosyltransferase family 4 protein n=1 Tax=Candidatus Xiphinematobacter sp. Idaho Grape TaxID=1704307 RepID=UPI000706A2F7|nr:glycosyltransferase family 4 protein [Candidatus Xiphinematobacter sp. Idaho Grape]ALJ56791.1 D-inositol 3-phosphate glycosyltransferase [Candidatus Xiphinematobacter sp. Idaho Grape]
MRILHVESGLNSGGEEYRIADEVQWLNAAGHHAWIACNPDSELFQAGLTHGMCVLPLKMVSIFAPPSTWKLYGLVRKLKCDLVHTHSPIDAWIAVPLRLFGVPIVRSRHITNPVGRSFFRTFCYRYGCDHLLPTARVIRNALLQYNRIPSEKMTVIGEGVDIKRFHPNVDGNEFRLLWGATPQDILFGCVGMLRPEKGQGIFIKAAAIVRKYSPKARFVVVGDNVKQGSSMRVRCLEIVQREFGYNGWKPENSISLSRETPLILHGHAEDVAAATAALDVAVVPSLREAQSRTAPEAICLGKPVITSCVGGLPEVVSAGETGLLVPPGNVEALAEAMLKLAEDSPLRSKLARKAAMEGRERFSLDSRMQETVRVYNKVLAESCP